MTDVNDPTQATPDQDTNPTDPEGSTGGSNFSFNKEDIDKLVNRNNHAQGFIETLKTEKQQLEDELRAAKEELESKSSFEEYLAQMRDAGASDPERPTAPEFDATSIAAQIEQQVFDRLSEREQQQARQQNFDTVISALSERHGDKYEDYMAQRAKELNMTNEQLLLMGAETPEALLSLMDANKRSTGPAPTHSSVRPPQGGDTERQESEFERVARAQRDMSTEEGMAARKLWNDPEWQKQQRLRILEKAQKN
jgi:hypothetical protein